MLDLSKRDAILDFYGLSRDNQFFEVVQFETKSNTIPFFFLTIPYYHSFT